MGVGWMEMMMMVHSRPITLPGQIVQIMKKELSCLDAAAAATAGEDEDDNADTTATTGQF